MLAVKSQYRGRGIATRLVSMAIDAMVENGADEVALETEVTNTPAMKLYERLGFIRSKRLHRYYLSGNSAYRLILYLKHPKGSHGGEGECDCRHDEQVEGEEEHEHQHNCGHGHHHHLGQGGEFDDELYI